MAFPSSMDSSHPTSVAAAQRQNKKEDQWPVLVQGLEDAYDDAQDLREVIEEARMANLPEAALRPCVSFFRNFKYRVEQCGKTSIVPRVCQTFFVDVVRLSKFQNYCQVACA